MTLAQGVEMQQRYAMAAQGISMADFITPRGEMEMVGETAVINISGALVKSAPPIHEKLGNTTYDTLNAEMDAALEAGATSAVFHIDSGGGGVVGLAEMSDKIASMGIPTYAFSDSVACSAAYHAMAACDHVHVTPSANIGNIGVVTAFSGEDNNNIQVITNEGADLKGAGMNGLTETQASFIQSRVDKLGEEFKIHINNHRTVDAEVFRAGWYYGEEALALGLADSDGTKEQLLSNI